MTMSFNLLVGVCLAYVTVLFVIAFWAERRARFGLLGWLRSPMIYTLSLSIYCTAWTFYGAVGYAARSGLEFVTIYLGPTLVMIGWWTILRRLVRIGRAQRITSIADLISSRYGKSNFLGVLVTVMAVVGTTPYIALQLQSVTLSFSVFAGHQSSGANASELNSTALWVAVGLALFTILFGTRNIDANERHHGIVTAIALEAVVKLVALLAVGAFVVWGIAGGAADILTRIDASSIAVKEISPGRWTTLIFLSSAAFLCLPRMFQVLVVENADESHLRTASWAFPAYLLAMSAFVVPIAVVGLSELPAGSNPDLFVLTLPLARDAEGLAMLSFLGGFSSATSMVIVAAIALATMVSNHIVMPIWLSSERSRATMSGDVRNILIMSRRLSIAAILALGYLYFRFSGGSASLAAIGLIAFGGVAQVLPALIGGIFWRGASRAGAATGLIIGFSIWAYSLFLPSFGTEAIMSARFLAEGPAGISWLRPQALFGITGLDPLVHAIFWSVTLNTLGFTIVSLSTFPGPLERLQGAQFVNVFEHSSAKSGWKGGAAEAEDLLAMAQRILGAAEAQALFRNEAARQGRHGHMPEASPELVETLERELSGSVGGATAHAMIGQIVGGSPVSVEDLLAVADEAAQILEHSTQLEQKSAELSELAGQLRRANDKLTEISAQKDAFLGQISHELRTPMTSIRAFSQILMEGGPALLDNDQSRYSRIIHEESQRLTRLLDDLLDLSVLENGQVTLNTDTREIGTILDRAQTALSSGSDMARLVIHRDPSSEMISVETDPDRLAQVFINLIANAGKYCDAEAPELTISVQPAGSTLQVDFVDNGSGIPAAQRDMIFEKFSRLGDQTSAGGAGLGLAICREIMTRLGGSIRYLDKGQGAGFRVSLPLGQDQRKAAE